MLFFGSSKEGRCFVGDVIFAGSVGRSDLPGGDFAVLEKSIRESIYTLPNETLLHPGHGEDTRVIGKKAPIRLSRRKNSHNLPVSL